MQYLLLVFLSHAIWWSLSSMTFNKEVRLMLTTNQKYYFIYSVKKTVLSAWSTKVVSICCPPMTKGITDILIICQLWLFVMVGQHILNKFVLQALNISSLLNVLIYFFFKNVTLFFKYWMSCFSEFRILWLRNRHVYLRLHKIYRNSHVANNFRARRHNVVTYHEDFTVAPCRCWNGFFCKLLLLLLSKQRCHLSNNHIRKIPYTPKSAEGWVDIFFTLQGDFFVEELLVWSQSLQGTICSV